MHPGHNGLVMLPWNLLILCWQNLETNGADGLAPFRRRLCVTPSSGWGPVSSSLQLRRPCYKLLSSSRRGSAEAAGCELPDSLWQMTWWWTRATRTRTSATIKSPSTMLTERVLTIFVNIFQKGKIKVIVLYFGLIYCTGTRREGLTYFIKSQLQWRTTRNIMKVVKI